MERTLVMSQPSWVKRLCPGQRFFQIYSKERFVPHRPDHHRGTVFIPVYISLNTVHHFVLIFRLIHQNRAVVYISHAVYFQVTVGLDVGLVDDVKSILVAHFVKYRRVGVVAGSDCVDIVLFHQHQVFFHSLDIYGASHHRIAVVAVGPAEFYFYTVDVYHRIFDGNFPDADPAYDHLMLCFQHQRIKVRIFRIPQHRLIYRNGELILRGGSLYQKRSFCIRKGILYRNLFSQKVQFYLYRSFLISVA